MKRTCNGCAALSDKRNGNGGCELGFNNRGELLPKGRHDVFDSFRIHPQEECPKPRTQIGLVKMWRLRDFCRAKKMDADTIKKMLINEGRQ